MKVGTIFANVSA